MADKLAGPAAHIEALLYLCSLVLRDGAFQEARRRLVDSFQWLVNVDHERAADLLDPLFKAMELMQVEAANVLALSAFGANLGSVADFMHHMVQLERYYEFDRIKNGSSFMFQMVVTGERPPRTWDPEEIFAWSPTFLVLPVERRRAWLESVQEKAERAWELVAAQRRERTRAEQVRLEDLHRYVEWYFQWTMADKAMWKVAMELDRDPGAFERGVKLIQGLLGIVPRSGRRPRKRIPTFGDNILGG